MPLMALVFTWDYKTGFLIFSCPDLGLKALQGWMINKQINSYSQQAKDHHSHTSFWVAVLSQAMESLKGKKSAAAKPPAVRAASVLVSIWLQHARRGNAWSHWHQPTRGQFSWHSTELTGKKRVLHSSALLPSQMESPLLGREDNPVGGVWENSLNTKQAGGFTILISPRPHSYCPKAEMLL